jgi:hypothetical protein
MVQVSAYCARLGASPSPAFKLGRNKAVDEPAARHRSQKDDQVENYFNHALSFENCWPVIVVVDSEDSLHDDHFAYSIVMNNWWPFHTHVHLYRCSCQPVNDLKNAGGEINSNSISLRFFRFVRFALLPKYYPPLRTNLDDISAPGHL